MGEYADDVVFSGLDHGHWGGDERRWAPFPRSAVQRAKAAAPFEFSHLVPVAKPALDLVDLEARLAKGRQYESLSVEVPTESLAALIAIAKGEKLPYQK